jgi:hypothetical protein
MNVRSSEMFSNTQPCGHILYIYTEETGYRSGMPICQFNPRAIGIAVKTLSCKLGSFRTFDKRLFLHRPNREK